MTFNAKPSINTILMSSHVSLFCCEYTEFTSESVYQKCRLVVIIRIVSVVPIPSCELDSVVTVDDEVIISAIGFRYFEAITMKSGYCCQ